MTYRKRLTSDTYHFVPTCHWWPMGNFVEKLKKPTSGAELCNECIAKAKQSKRERKS